jgi:hypothetical protein
MTVHALKTILHNIPELVRTEARGTALDGAIDRARKAWMSAAV